MILRLTWLSFIFILCILTTKLQAVYVGRWDRTSHGISGSVSYDTPTRLSLNDFYYDGTGIETYLYYYRTGDQIGTSSGHSLPFEQSGERQDRYKFSRRYTNETILAYMPSGRSVCDIDGLAIWCEPFKTAFAVVFVYADAVVERGTHGECRLRGSDNEGGPSRNLPPLAYENCVTYFDLEVQWNVDADHNEIDFRVCNCDTSLSVNKYIGFGPSGNNDSVSMLGADVTIGWVDKQTGRPFAVDYYISGRFQCRDGAGVCPDTAVTDPGCTDDIRQGSVGGGIRDNSEICVSYSRPFKTGDHQCDIGFNIDQFQHVIWAVGDLGEKPLKHYSKAYQGTLPIKFRRSPPRRECDVHVCPKCAPFHVSQIALPLSSTLHVNIGPSGIDQGYSAITGQPNWGDVAWYLNNSLIPEIVVKRGKTYTFIIEGGADPKDTSNYHPFYITSSKSGGRLMNTLQEQKAEIVYAGFDSSGSPTGVGRLCEYVETSEAWRVRAQECGSKEKYLMTIFQSEPNCHSGVHGALTWTPDENTPDVVYYQCAMHPNQGWKIIVRPKDFIKTPTGKSGSPMIPTFNIITFTIPFLFLSL